MQKAILKEQFNTEQQLQKLSSTSFSDLIKIMDQKAYKLVAYKKDRYMVSLDVMLHKHFVKKDIHYIVPFSNIGSMFKVKKLLANRNF